MKNENKAADLAFFDKVQRGLWFLLSLFAVYILYETFGLVESPSAHQGMYLQIPEMTEHLLAGVVGALGLAAFVDCFVDR